ncbi:MAG TPA: asparaginase [Candidatus Baltobacteraceae bacterium]|jgi:L-asparaginase II
MDWVKATRSDVVRNAAGTVDVYRGSYLESVHSFLACIADADGNVIEAHGGVDQIFPVRSLAKPFIAAELVRSGTAEAFAFTDAELALSAGSHDGEPIHVAAVLALLRRLDLDESVLQCGPAMEGKVLVGTPAANNCSGKHAAILAMCRHESLVYESYLDPLHPIQQRLLARLFLDFSCPSDTAIATDGCGLPIFGSSLKNIAVAYARFGVSTEESTAAIRLAMTTRPEFMGGTHANLDTNVICNSGGAVLGKIGAEGLHADTIVGTGIGIAIKICDGNSRAIGPALVQTLEKPLQRAHGDSPWLREFALLTVTNASGTTVGQIVARAK